VSTRERYVNNYEGKKTKPLISVLETKFPVHKDIEDYVKLLYNHLGEVPKMTDIVLGLNTFFFELTKELSGIIKEESTIKYIISKSMNQVVNSSILPTAYVIAEVAKTEIDLIFSEVKESLLGMFRGVEKEDYRDLGRKIPNKISEGLQTFSNKYSKEFLQNITKY